VYAIHVIQTNEIFHDAGAKGKDVHKVGHGNIPMVSNPTNQTTSIGKNPKEWNPLKFLWNSFEQNEQKFQLEHLISSTGTKHSNF
jgi:hypothetical protein